MLVINENFSWKVRKKRALLRINISEASKQIGVSRQTLSLIESGKKNKVNKIVFEKITNWLLGE